MVKFYYMFEKINLINFINLVNQQMFESAIESNNVDELQIHKILYIIYGNFYAHYGSKLFADAKFIAHKYGPVEIDFKHQYDSKIDNDKFNVYLTSEQKDFLFKFIEKTLRFSPWSLVNFTHNSDPWLNNFDKDEMIIPNDQICKWFKDVNNSISKPFDQ